jgi:hypothetical protein
MSSHPPRTSYGYLAPPEARPHGWECNEDGCGVSDRPAPRSWPHPCPSCGGATDASFPEPWAHEARRYRIRHDLAGPAGFRREHARIEQHVWAYKDTGRRSDQAAEAWRAFHQARPDGWERTDTSWIGSSALFEMVWLAAERDDIGRAADELLECHPYLDTTGLDDNGLRRGVVRNFVSMCIRLLEREASVDDPSAERLHAAMRDVAERAEEVLMADHRQGFQRIGEVRARHRSRAAITRARRSPEAAVEGLPPIWWPGEPEIAAALSAAEARDDTGPLDEVISRPGRPGLRHLLRARRFVPRIRPPGACGRRSWPPTACCRPGPIRRDWTRASRCAGPVARPA